MSTFRIVGRCIADPPPVDWHARLCMRLGIKPRRIGTWAELGLYGALECLADADETKLSEQANLILSSRHGPVSALRRAVEQANEDLPMPLTFLQTQPSQLLATLAQSMRWRGDARFITHDDPCALLRLAAVQNYRDGVLLGWVEESAAGSSVWLRLMPCVEPPGALWKIDSLEQHLAKAGYLRITPTEVSGLPPLS